MEEQHLLKLHIIEENRSRTSADQQEFVEFLINEISDSVTCKHHVNRESLVLYSVVKAGNTLIVRKVLQHLKEKSMNNELCWVIGKTSCKSHQGLTSHIKICHVTSIILYCIITVIMSPVFYIGHSLLNNCYNRFRTHVEDSITLPLLFAVLSEKKEMVKLFLEFGSDVSLQDKYGNNIYHCLANMSATYPAKAIKCHQMLSSCFDDVTDLCESLMEQQNYMKLTPLELLFRNGSLEYLQDMLETRGCVGRKIMDISDSKIYASTSKACFDIKLHPTTQDMFMRYRSKASPGAPDHSHKEKEKSVSVWRYDFNRYNRHDIFGNHSFILHLIADRPMDTLSEQGAKLISDSKILNQWMAQKQRMYWFPCLVAHTVSLTITVLLLLYILIHGDDIRQYPMARIMFDKVINNIEQNKTNPYQSAVQAVDTVCKGHLPADYTHQGQLRPAEDISHSITDDFLHTDYLLLVITLLVTAELFVDISVRLLFLWRNFDFKAQSPTNAIIPILCRWIPGSYAEKQIAMFMYILFCISIYVSYAMDISKHNFDEISNILIERRYLGQKPYNVSVISGQALEYLQRWQSLESGLAMTYMVCLLLRFLHTIHALRLLPGIGFFVITTKKMSRHLVYFGMVFTLVLLAFAAVFHLELRQPQCPALRTEGFQSLPQSLYSTYQVILGHGDHTDHFSYNLSSQVAYLTSTIIIIIMLMNLIIAVMTTTATDLNTNPWKDVICKLEVWDELLGTEAQMLTVTTPCHYIRSKIVKQETTKCQSQPRCCIKLSQETSCTFTIAYDNAVED